jgi:putative membrane protein
LRIECSASDCAASNARWSDCQADFFAALASWPGGPFMNDREEKPQRAGLADYLAAERTLLAWIRTGLALMGFGFVIARFALFLEQLQFIQQRSGARSFGMSLWFGTALIATGGTVNLLAGWHHLKLVRRLDRGQATGGHSTMLAVAAALFLALVGLAMAIYLISVRDSARSFSSSM